MSPEEAPPAPGKRGACFQALCCTWCVHVCARAVCLIYSCPVGFTWLNVLFNDRHILKDLSTWQHRPPGCCLWQFSVFLPAPRRGYPCPPETGTPTALHGTRNRSLERETDDRAVSLSSARFCSGHVHLQDRGPCPYTLFLLGII